MPDDLAFDDVASAETRVVEAIQSAAHTGKISDGKIMVLDLLNAIRVRTGETGEAAV